VSDLPPFVPFGLAHLGTLASVGLLAVALVALVRARPALGRPVRLALAAGIVVLVAFELSVGAREGWLGWTALLPLELCDAALVLAVVTLVAPRRAAAEVVYFWAGSGTLLAMLTPELPWSFPRWEFVVFFGLHGLVLVAALVLVFGLGLRPRPGAPFRVLGITAGWAAIVGLVDLALGTNYMYLRHKPIVPTPLDWMGPWPVYIGVGAAVALVLFLVLALPFRREWQAERPTLL
jgi:hypothetical integral membrane protein (TIGR02206 family)